MIDLTVVIEIAIVTIGIALSIVGIPVLRAHFSNEQLQKLQFWVTIGVQAAEQLMKTGKINKDDRKKFVMDFLQSKNFTIDMDAIDACVESTVLRLPSLSDSEESSNKKYMMMEEFFKKWSANNQPA